MMEVFQLHRYLEKLRATENPALCTFWLLKTAGVRGHPTRLLHRAWLVQQVRISVGQAEPDKLVSSKTCGRALLMMELLVKLSSGRRI